MEAKVKLLLDITVFLHLHVCLSSQSLSDCDVPSAVSANVYLPSLFPLCSSGCAKAGGVRFSEDPPAAGAPSHVHFDEKLHDSVVMVTPEDDGNFMVKVRSPLQ